MTARRNDRMPVVIVGAGLTGLSAAYVLHENGVPVRVLEADAEVGGASKTVQFKGFRFDLGGHRFYTRNQEVLGLVHKLIGNELLTVPRQSRIYLRGKFVDYPFTFTGALSTLGVVTSMSVCASYALEKVKRIFCHPQDTTFEDWVISRFGRKLYSIYFKPYSEKVWGVPCAELKADFAEQRIRGLSFREAVKNMFVTQKNAPATLVKQFLYPKLGFGRIPESMAANLPAGSIELESPVIRVEHNAGRVTRVVCRNKGGERSIEAGHLISTMAVSNLIKLLSPPAPDAVADAAAGLRYRDMVIVFLALNREQVSPDQWLYFSSDGVFFGRMHEPRNWSDAMSPPGKTSLVVEIFCYEDEPVWRESDASVTRRVIRRLAELEMIDESECEAAMVVRLRKAYPLYAGDYLERLAVVMSYLDRFENLQTAGRNGLFRYTSGDYYIEMGMKAGENVLERDHDLNAVAAAKEYAEK